MQNQSRIVSENLPVCPVLQILSPRRELRLSQNLNRHKPVYFLQLHHYQISVFVFLFLGGEFIFLKNAIAEMSPRRELKIRIADSSTQCQIVSNVCYFLCCLLSLRSRLSPHWELKNELRAMKPSELIKDLQTRVFSTRPISWKQICLEDANSGAYPKCHSSGLLGGTSASCDRLKPTHVRGRQANVLW